MNRSDDLISVLTEEHRDQRQLLTELQQLTGHGSLRRSLADLLIAEMVRHTVAEDAYLHPVARERLPERPRLADQHIAEHEQLEQTLKGLERHDLTTGEEFSLLLSRLDTEVRTHTRSEEEELFPLLARHLSKEELTALGQKALEAKKKASIPQRLSERPRNPIFAAGAGLVERVRIYLYDRAYPL